MSRSIIIMICFSAVLGSIVRGADQYELPPIDYSRATPHNRVSVLQETIDRQESLLRWEKRFGYLRDLLERLEIRSDTQMLVFSKTSMQRDHISPHSPRAIYFNDDTYVGYCNQGDMIEIAAADPKLGAVFYTLDQTNKNSPVIQRQTNRCLQCHGGGHTDNLPGFLVRSLFVSSSGLPILSEGSHRVDHSTPIEHRWGGWYVSGTHEAQTHLGNLVVRDQRAQRPWTNEAGQNVTDLSGRFSVRNYLTPHSDIVALMVFEHQTHVHNLITNANFTARQALSYEREFNKALGEPADNRLESTTRRIKSAGDKLLAGLLMSGEQPLKGTITGTSPFTSVFSAIGPFDPQGRSLRQLDLERRLFKYPCSYLIYSPEFAALPPPMMEYVQQQLQQILAGNGGENFSHLDQSDRQAIQEILKSTKPELLTSQ